MPLFLNEKEGEIFWGLPTGRLKRHCPGAPRTPEYVVKLLPTLS